MRCQQVLSGAANSGTSTVAHSSYEGVGFTVYCTGCDLVILDDQFCRVQLISNVSGCRTEIKSLSLCPASGNIAAVCAYNVVVLTPSATKHDDEFPYVWDTVHTLKTGSTVSCASWNHDGTHLLTGDIQLSLWSSSDWRMLWSCLLTDQTTQITFSPDGRFFTTLSEKTKVLKLWKGGKNKSGKWDYRSELLSHPDTVVSACWRELTNDIPSKAVRQVLLTSCKDCIGRVWLESPSLLPSSSIKRSITHSFVLGTVLDPLKDASEKMVQGSPYIFQWFNNKTHAFSTCVENAQIKAEIQRAEAASVSSYDDVSDQFECIDADQQHTKITPKAEVKDSPEYKSTIEKLVKIWYQSFDLVVCVSPSTGSLMGWRVERIDISYPHQCLSTRFVLRLPWSLTYADARILKPVFQVFRSRKIGSNSDKGRSLLRHPTQGLKKPRQPLHTELSNTLVDVDSMILPYLCLLTSHSDGTVNLFTFEMGEGPTFTDISNLVHEVRCSGHRCPPLKSLSHSYIPLVLTTSAESGTLDQPGYGELVLWRVSCIGPMTTRKTGILELARVDTPRASDFTEISWFPKAFSVIPPQAKEYAGVLTSFVLHFVAYTGQSLELYRVVTLSENIQAAKMIMDKAVSVQCGVMSEANLISKSSGSGASKIYHVGRIAEVEEGCEMLHTFEEGSVSCTDTCLNETEKEGYFVVFVGGKESGNTTTTIQVMLSQEEVPGTLIELPQSVHQVHTTFFCARWVQVDKHPLPLPPAVYIKQCCSAANTVATPKFVPPGTHSPYLISAMCSDNVIRFLTLTGESNTVCGPEVFKWTEWPVESTVCVGLPILKSSKEPDIVMALNQAQGNYSVANSMPGRTAVSCPGAKGLTMLMYECESTGGSQWLLEDSLTLKPETGETSGPVLMDWMSAANGTHILAVVQGATLWIITSFSCISLHNDEGTIHHMESAKVESWVALLRVSLSTQGKSIPRSLSWNSTGSLLLGINAELQLFSPWYTREEVSMMDSHAHLERGVGNIYNDALSLQPRLPQYHPYVLRELIDSRKVPEVKQILQYLTNYLTSYRRAGKHRFVELSSVIDIIPPLPLYDMCNLDPQLFMNLDNSDTVDRDIDYSALLMTSAYLDESDDEPGLLSDDEEHINYIRQRSISHSEREDTAVHKFGPKEASRLDDLLTHYQLPGVTRQEQMTLSCLALTIGDINQNFSDDAHKMPIGQDLDDSGLRFTLELKFQNSVAARAEKLPLKPHDFIWAFHSQAQTQLIELIPGYPERKLKWEDLRSTGAGWWIKSSVELKRLIEIVCKTRFQGSQNPLECALFYLAMHKKTLLQGLYRTVRDLKMATFLKHDFTESRWKTAAKKNAFVLLGQQRFEHAAAFFLLADCLEDSLEVILKHLKDIQLALVIARLYEDPVTTAMRRVLNTHVLGVANDAKTVGTLCSVRHEPDPFLCSMSHWWLGDYSSALYCLLRPATLRLTGHLSRNLPGVFDFYCYLFHHPLLQRCRNEVCLPFTAPDIEEGAAGVIALERRLIFTTAHVHYNMGAPFLALEVLKYIKEGFTTLKEANRAISKQNQQQISTGMLVDPLQEESETITSTATVTSSLVTSEASSAGIVDTDWMSFKAPVKSRFDMDEEYQMSSSDDSSVISSEDEASVIDQHTTEDTADGLSALPSELGEEEEEKETSNDPFILQLQLKCCIKIVADELRTLPHALLDKFDPDLGPFGGRARLRSRVDQSTLLVQPGANNLGLKVCQWLKNEIETMSKICGLKFSNLILTDLDEEDPNICRDAMKFNFKLEESILTILLLFCILHGDLDYNLAALRLELLFLLQEFHLSDNLSSLMKSMEESAPESDSIDLPPLLSATAPPPLLLTPLNMLWQLTGHILKLINRCQVQHTTAPSEIQILNSLSLSASACMWQCIALRHGGTHIPNSYAIVKHSPLSWPGLSGHTVYFLVSAGKAFLVNKEREGAMPIAIVLVEAIIAVYLGLFLHACCNSDAGVMTLLLYNVPTADMWTKVTGTTVQSVDTSSPNLEKKRVSIMSPQGDRIRIKGPRAARSQQSVVTVRETFLPPSMSLVEYFKRESPLDTSTMFDVDSDCEDTLDGDGDDPDDYSCYSWHLMRLLSVHYIHNKLDQFLLDIGIATGDLAGLSPLLASSMRTLVQWSEELQQKLDENFPAGPDFNLLPPLLMGYSLAQSLADPHFSPFRMTSKSSLSTRVLWHKLAVNTDMISYLERKYNTDAEYTPGVGEVQTLFQSQEGVSSFACYQNTLSLMVVTTPHEILEIDVKSWLNKDTGVKCEEGASEDDGMPFLIINTEESGRPANQRSNMPDYADQNDTPDAFNQVLKRAEQGVRCCQSHDDLPLYITGHSDGYVKLWEFGYPKHLARYGLSGTRGRITNIHFSPLGAKFGLSDTNGVVGLWHTTVNTNAPFCVLQCHDRAARDFAFLGSASVLVSVGSSSNNRNVVIWDTLLPPDNCAVKKFQAHEMGAMVCCYSPKRQLLLTGGNKGDICIFDVRQRKLQHMFNAHDSSVRSMCLSPSEETYFTGSSEGEIKSWSFGNSPDCHSYTDGHKSNKFFSSLPGGSLKGVMKLHIDSSDHLISCGADGEVKLRRLSGMYT